MSGPEIWHDTAGRRWWFRSDRFWEGRQLDWEAIADALRQPRRLPLACTSEASGLPLQPGWRPEDPSRRWRGIPWGAP